jgi:hypothetical protein
MKTLIRKSIKITLFAVFAVFSNSCEKSKDEPKEAVVDVTRSGDYEKIKKDAENITQLISKIVNDDNFLSLNDDKNKFNYIKKVASDDFGVSSDYQFEDFKKAKKEIMLWEYSKASANARTSWADNPMASFSMGEKQFIDFAMNSTQNTSTVSVFNTQISSLRNGLNTPGYYTWLNYSTDRIIMLHNWLNYYEQFGNNWPDDLDNFWPYSQSRTDATARTNGSCKGFFKKLCVAKWTALFAIAGSAANLGGGTLIGAAAGYLVGRCCKCCTCDAVTCDL